MIQLCYTSESTSPTDHLLNDLRAILNEARNFNFFHDLTGVLYYADGRFFQCLEGNSISLSMLIEKIKKDHRHKNFKLFDFYEVEERSFAEWSMKYVPRHGVIQKFMNREGFSSFRPEYLTTIQAKQLIELLADRAVL